MSKVSFYEEKAEIICRTACSGNGIRAFVDVEFVKKKEEKTT